MFVPYKFIFFFKYLMAGRVVSRLLGSGRSDQHSLSCQYPFCLVNTPQAYHWWQALLPWRRIYSMNQPHEAGFMPNVQFVAFADVLLLAVSSGKRRLRGAF
jgi:hypothetical protein